MKLQPQVLKKFTSRLPLMLISLVLCACANVMSPSGGPRDEDPPVVVRSTPPNYSPNYAGEQIRIYFDEFITLTNLRQQLLISPPLQEDPEIRVRGKSIIIDIKDTLRENTTYNMFLGDAVRDITEGNAIPNFQYVFSTGDFVDSLSISGQVVEAFTLSPVQGVSVMLYDSIYDSIPYKERPVYFSRTNKEGGFTISNMREGAYLIFALVDNNANFLYDLPDEKIAFLDSLVVPRYVPPVVAPDTIATDSIFPGEGATEREDAVVTGLDLSDEVTGLDLSDYAMPHHSLYLFQEKDTVQRVTSTNVIRKGQISFSFRVPFDSVCLRDLSKELPDDWYIPEFSQPKDTLTIWFTGIEQDTLFLEIFDGVQLLDTIRTSAKPRVSRGRQASEHDEPLPLTITPGSRQGRSTPHFNPFTLSLSAPLDTMKSELISMVVHDSLDMDVSFSFHNHVRRTLVMDQELEQGVQYQLHILPGAFTDIFGATNDTLVASFRTSTLEEYGVVIMNVTINDGEQSKQEQPKTSGYILQLLDGSGNALLDKIIGGSGMYIFPNLTPGNYRFRLIEDRNQNGVWDTGNYLKGIQPERVFMFEEQLQVRQNWELEMSWEIQIKPLTLPHE